MTTFPEIDQAASIPHNNEGVERAVNAALTNPHLDNHQKAVLYSIIAIAVLQNGDKQNGCTEAIKWAKNGLECASSPKIKCLCIYIQYLAHRELAYRAATILRDAYKIDPDKQRLSLEKSVQNLRDLKSG